MVVDHNQVRELFLAATELPVSRRVVYLIEKCGPDVELQAAVERLLTAHMNPASILEPMIERAGSNLVSHAQQTTHSHPQQRDVGTSLEGRYILLEVIGEGGMGTVWMAQQNEPVKRIVAVKLIKPGMDSKLFLARFEAERQALALMDHPNIARVLDAGVAADGRPFFVMDLVKGEPITHFCDGRKFTPRERLELFVPVCQAIQHAHQKGIIHRDIKPSNVLVVLQDGRAVPKVIDFGVAKAIGQPLTELSLNTSFGTVIGTPQYMSPEQATFNNLDVDTRSDLYSLGVLLYELLAGSPPFAKEDLEKAGVLEMLRVVREDEPPRPSTKLSTADALPSLAANRSTEPRKLMGILRNELDWIVLKALEKDRTRRYETANGFAADIQRYLSGEQVLAVPPSVGYRLRKFLRKHRGPAIAATLMAILLLAGVTVSSWQTVRAIRAEEKALLAADEARQAQLAEAKRAEGERDAKQLALEAAQAEKKALVQANKRLAQIEKGYIILASIFSDLDIRKIRADTTPLEVVLGHRLAKVAWELEDDAIGDILVVANLQNRLGITLLSLEFPSDAQMLFNKAYETRRILLGEDNHDTLACLNNLADCYLVTGKSNLARPIFEKIYACRKAKQGADHNDTLSALNNLAGCYRSMGMADRAIPLMEEVVKSRIALQGKQHPKTLEVLSNLAMIYHSAGKFDQALALCEETYNLMRVSPTEHPNLLSTMHNLAVCYKAKGRFELALPLLEETYKRTKSRFGAEHYQTLNCYNSLATCYQDTGRLDLAVPLYEEILKIRKQKQGTDHPDTLFSCATLAIGYHSSGKAELAFPLYLEAAKGMEKRGFQHEYAGRLVKVLINFLLQRQQFDDAETWRRKWIAVVKDRSGADSIAYAVELSELGHYHFMPQRKWSDTENVLRESLAIREMKEPDAWNTFYIRSLLGQSLLDQEKYVEAEPLLNKGYEGMKARRDKIPPTSENRLPEVAEQLVRFYETTGKKDAAAKWRRELQTFKMP
jgi:serine/threonine protein kinase/tetratricopeptide (TPR) repeat protein